MSEEHLSRKRLLQAGGGVVVSSTILGKVASAAAANTSAAGGESDTIAVLTAVQGRNGSATAVGGAVFSGKIQNLRPLRVGDRVVVESGADGYTISPLFVEVAGTVDSIEPGEVRVEGASYAVDSDSVLRRLRNGRWVDSGPLAKSIDAGAEIEGLGIVNLDSGQTTLALAWAR